jgi:serine/threonine protein kinase
MDLELGVRIGDFEIEGRLGAGGMGIVYRARQLSLNRVVALKILGPALDSEEGKTRFRREAQAVAKLNHAGIASIYFIGQDEHVCFFAMEYIDGVSLRKVLDRLTAEEHPGLSIESAVLELKLATTLEGAKLERFDEPTAACESPPELQASTPDGEPRQDHANQFVRSAAYINRCCEIARDVAQALAHAHERGVIHRDIKPENLLLNATGRVYVVDFGLARFHEDMTLTNTGSLVGTPMYMSPEQVSGRLAIDHRTDVYSLGLVLYEMVTLRRPIEAATREGVLRQVMTKSRLPLRWKNPAVPRDLERVVHKAIAHDPDERYQSSESFATDLQNILARKPVNAPPYRYRADLREIAAERPASVTASSILLMLALLLGVPNYLIFSVVMEWFGRLRSSPLMDAFAAIITVGAFLWVPLVASVCLYLGYSWTRWVLSIYLGVVIAGRLLAVQRFGFDGSTLFVCAIAAGIIVVLFRRATHDWFRLAARLRAEQRGWRNAARQKPAEVEPAPHPRRFAAGFLARPFGGRARGASR